MSTIRTPGDPHNPALAIACPLESCRQPGGQFCRQPSGAIAPWTHQARVRALRELEREAANAL